MAIYTPLPSGDADRVTFAHGLGPCTGVEGLSAGSVNSNFFVDTREGRFFVRIYEEQEVDGVAYEWALLEHLASRGLAVPRRVTGPAPGELRVAGKPVACFEVVEGEMLCQQAVDAERAATVGRFLARAHLAGSGFGRHRRGRFTRADIRARLDAVARRRRPELAAAVPVLERTLADVEREWDDGLPRGVIHGDLFRDNVHWEGARIAAALDWESASDGLFVYDLAVTLLAWCYDESLRWDLARRLVRGYEARRPLAPDERAFIGTALRAAAARFTVTRITDFHLREGDAPAVKKDWRRFLARLEAVSGPLDGALFG